MKEQKISFAKKTGAKVLLEGAKIPKASCGVDVDAGALIGAKNYGLKLDAIFLSAIAEIMYLEMPETNTSWVEDSDEPKLIFYENLNLGLALEAKNGLTVVTIKDAEHKNIWQLNSEIKELAEKAKANRLDLACFVPKPNVVFNNVGVYPNIIRGNSIMQPWNTIMVSAFRIADMPVAVQKSIVIRPIMKVDLYFDHRPIDGKTAAGFLNLLKSKLENPLFS